MWKGGATAAATMNATNYVAFAKAGLTGPSEPFEGECGVMAVATGEFDLAIPAYPGGKFIVEMSHQKMFPAETHAQAILGLVPKIRAWASVDEIESIDVEAYGVLVIHIGSHPSVWDPHTRETADHSLPYLLAVALVDGSVTPASFAPERIADAALRPVMAKVSIRENPEWTANYRPRGLEIAGSPRARVSIRTTDGREMVEEVTYAKGHLLNPMGRDDVDAKIDQICAGVLTDAHRDRLKETWWAIGESDDVHAAMATMADFGSAGDRSTDGSGEAPR
jgi:2-methylcitrate dehydratase